MSERYRLHLGDCRDRLPQIATDSVDAIITDPPYPEVKRPYGTLSVGEWWELMTAIVPECRRVLKPSGSAVFILQPNSEHVGQMRSWLWDFISWGIRNWNMVQDVYWWNYTPFPIVHCQRRYGLMRQSVKYCLWFGAPDCYRNQDEILWEPSQATKAANLSDRALQRRPSGGTMRSGRANATALQRGGSTPMNLIPAPNANSSSSSGALGHGAGTPLAVARWWVRYICPADGVILDPFAGAGTIGEAALEYGRYYIGIERLEKYHPIIEERLGSVQQRL